MYNCFIMIKIRTNVCLENENKIKHNQASSLRNRDAYSCTCQDILAFSCPFHQSCHRCCGDNFVVYYMLWFFLVFINVWMHIVFCVWMSIGLCLLTKLIQTCLHHATILIFFDIAPNHLPAAVTVGCWGVD